ncbi:hypothetical protein GJ496_005804 [Pomphorhynchus laevis]|nr:hypothetical protein GJ496_005804 [Pomphorhynchus laevis]
MTTNEEIQFPAFRSFNDFLLDARWSMPDFNDLNKINNRVLNNLLYYQTNYFLMGFIMFLCVGCENNEQRYIISNPDSLMQKNR